ncbi:MAG: hypothetical protein ACK2T3_06570, partial [Candidatus Promineifilaceae bacterium]
ELLNPVQAGESRGGVIAAGSFPLGLLMEKRLSVLAAMSRCRKQQKTALAASPGRFYLVNFPNY